MARNSGGQDESSDKLAGYELSELAKTPAKPPKPVETESAKATSNHNVKLLVGVGAAMFLIGAAIMLINVPVGFIIVVFGGLAVVLAVFLPIR